jgi:microsomal dipeptidase-like Zn-dependent dipeptidase
MYPEYIKTLFGEAHERGLERMVVSHPDFVIGADPALCRELIGLGAFIEHEVGMYDPDGNMKWDPKQLLTWIETLGPEHTVLSSDFGQAANPKPVDAWLRVAAALLDLGLPEKDLRRMVRDNPAHLLGAHLD